MSNRNKALARGDKHYIGLPCKRCGNTVRFVSTRSCTECHRLYQQDEWVRKKNNEEERRRYAERKAEREMKNAESVNNWQVP